MSQYPQTPAELKAWRALRGLSMAKAMQLAGNDAKHGYRTWQDWERGERSLPWYLPKLLDAIDRARESP